MGLALASISFTLSSSGVFASIRQRLSKFHPKIDELIHCPYCMSHWIGVLFIPEINGRNLISKLIGYFAMICISGLCHYVLLRAYEPVAKAKLQRLIDQAVK